MGMHSVALSRSNDGPQTWYRINAWSSACFSFRTSNNSRAESFSSSLRSFKASSYACRVPSNVTCCFWRRFSMNTSTLLYSPVSASFSSWSASSHYTHKYQPTRAQHFLRARQDAMWSWQAGRTFSSSMRLMPCCRCFSMSSSRAMNAASSSSFKHSVSFVCTRYFSLLTFSRRSCTVCRSRISCSQRVNRMAGSSHQTWRAVHHEAARPARSSDTGSNTVECGLYLLSGCGDYTRGCRLRKRCCG
jgi:hypothetical protein